MSDYCVIRRGRLRIYFDLSTWLWWPTGPQFKEVRIWCFGPLEVQWWTDPEARHG